MDEDILFNKIDIYMKKVNRFVLIDEQINKNGGGLPMIDENGKLIISQFNKEKREKLTELFLEKDSIILEISKLGKEINEFKKNREI